MAMWGNKRNYSKSKKTNTQFNYLHKYRVPSEVISPISLGIEPVRSLLYIAFGSKIWEVSKWHGEKTTDITVNGRRQILSSITYANQVLQVRSSVQSHWEWYHQEHWKLNAFSSKRWEV